LEAGGWRLEVGSWKLEVGNWKMVNLKFFCLSICHFEQREKSRDAAIKD
jgi:hypothetical protein